MGNYTSYLSFNEEQTTNNMEIIDSDAEDAIVINRSFSDSALEIMSESSQNKIVKAVGALEINSRKVENAISCIYLKNKMKDSFRYKIDELNETLEETQDQLDDLHFLNSRLRHKYNRDIELKNSEIRILKEQLSILNLKYEFLTKKKNE
jgi:hypothetical protein